MDKKKKERWWWWWWSLVKMTTEWSSRSQSIYFLLLLLFLRYAGLSLLLPLPLRSTGSGHAGSAAMAHGPSRSAACGIFPDWGTNPCPLHQQADSQPLRHHGSPKDNILINHLGQKIIDYADKEQYVNAVPKRKKVVKFKLTKEICK